MSDDSASRLREIRQRLDPSSGGTWWDMDHVVQDVSWLLDRLDALTRERDEAREACPAVRMDRFADAPLIELVNEQVSQLFRMQAQAEASRATLARVQGLMKKWRQPSRAFQLLNPLGVEAVDECADELEAALSSPLPAEEKP